jgi:phosphatidylglycerol:prolipoprotein diacylglycerol transferase
MRPLLVRIGPVSVYAFGAMMALGFVAGFLLLRAELRRRGEPADLAWAILAAAVVGGVVGARVDLALHAWSTFAADPARFFLAQSGLVWYGGLAGGLLATWWPIRAYGVRWLVAADCCAPGLALGYAFGKLGCHLAGDGDWGTPTTLPWGVVYPEPVVPWPHPPGVRVHPAPLYELAAALGTFAVLWRMRDRPAPAGALFGVYLVLVGAARFAVELVRTNRPVLLGLTEAQWISVGAIAGGVLLARRLGPPRSSPR